MKNSNTLEENIVAAIQSVVGTYPVALHEPSFDSNEHLYVEQCLDSTYVSSVGKFVDQFESNLANYTGSRFAVAVAPVPSIRVRNPRAYLVINFNFS